MKAALAVGRYCFLMPIRNSSRARMELTINIHSLLRDWQRPERLYETYKSLPGILAGRPTAGNTLHLRCTGCQGHVRIRTEKLLHRCRDQVTRQSRGIYNFHDSLGLVPVVGVFGKLR